MIKTGRGVLIAAFALVASGCTTSILGGGLPKTAAESVEIKQAKADDEAEKAMVAKIAKLLRAGTTQKEVADLLVAIGYSEANASRLLARALLK